MKREVIVSSLGFSEDGINVEWLVLPDDVRSQSHIVSSRSTAVSFQAPAGLGEAATDLRTAVDAFGLQLLTALEAEGVLPVYEEPAQVETLGYQPIAVDDDDDDIGMGEGR